MRLAYACPSPTGSTRGSRGTSGCSTRPGGLTDRSGDGALSSGPSPDQEPERRGRRSTAVTLHQAARRARQPSRRLPERDSVGLAGEPEAVPVTGQLSHLQRQRGGQLGGARGASSQQRDGACVRERSACPLSLLQPCCGPCRPVGGQRTSGRGQSLRRQTSGGEAGGGGGGAGSHHARPAALHGQRSLQAQHNRRGDASHF